MNGEGSDDVSDRATDVRAALRAARIVGVLRASARPSW